MYTLHTVYTIHVIVIHGIIFAVSLSLSLYLFVAKSLLYCMSPPKLCEHLRIPYTSMYTVLSAPNFLC